MIKRIEVTNFKSFKELKLEFGKFNVVIGANASGKSNLIQIFKFLRDILNYGLDNAISLQGGVEYLRNMKIGASKNFSLKVVLEEKFTTKVFGKPKESIENIMVRMYDLTYEFELKFEEKEPKYKIVKDVFTSKCEFIEKQRKEKKIGEGEIIITHSNDKIDAELRKKPEKLPITVENIFPYIPIREVQPNEPLIQTPFVIPFVFPLRLGLGDISIYDFDPKLPKKATPITGKVELEEDGSNLSIIIKNITENEEKRRKLFNLMKDLLPFIDDLNVEKFADKSLLFKLRETYFTDQYLPASLISDGTINITALIIALYFEEKPLIIIEEPERNIHPYLIRKVVSMMKDASRGKQIIITTHNPEIVKHADLKDLLLVTRDKDGFSSVFRPIDKEEVKIFLQNEMGIEELYIQNLLGI